MRCLGAGEREGRAIIESDCIPSLILNCAQSSHNNLVPLRQQLLDEGLLRQRPAQFRDRRVKERRLALAGLSSSNPPTPALQLAPHAVTQSHKQHQCIHDLTHAEREQGAALSPHQDRDESPDRLASYCHPLDPDSQPRELLPFPQCLEVEPLREQLQYAGEGVEGESRVEM
jgi:hypothetical protein